MDKSNLHNVEPTLKENSLDSMSNSNVFDACWAQINKKQLLGYKIQTYVNHESITDFKTLREWFKIMKNWEIHTNHHKINAFFAWLDTFLIKNWVEEIDSLVFFHYLYYEEDLSLDDIFYFFKDLNLHQYTHNSSLWNLITKTLKWIPPGNKEKCKSKSFKEKNWKNKKERRNKELLIESDYVYTLLKLKFWDFTIPPNHIILQRYPINIIIYIITQWEDSIKARFVKTLNQAREENLASCSGISLALNRIMEELWWTQTINWKSVSKFIHWIRDHNKKIFEQINWICSKNKVETRNFVEKLKTDNELLLHFCERNWLNEEKLLFFIHSYSFKQ